MSNEILQNARDFIVKNINPEFIIVFGSYSSGMTHSHSDIDIAFYCENDTFTSYEIFMVAQKLADILKIEVDLIDLREASTVFATQIFSNGNRHL